MTKEDLIDGIMTISEEVLRMATSEDQPEELAYVIADGVQEWLDSGLSADNFCWVCHRKESTNGDR